MADDLPHPLRFAWPWLIFFTAPAALVVAVGLEHDPAWLLTPMLWVFVLPSVLMAAGSLYGPWSCQRALRAFAEQVGQPFETVLDPRKDSGHRAMALRWPRAGLEAVAIRDLKMPASWSLSAGFRGRAWAFRPWSAGVVAREVLAHMGRGDQVRAVGPHPVPWAVGRGLWWGIPLFALTVAGFAFLWAPPGWAVPMAAGCAAALYILGLWSHERTRAAVARFAQGLDDAGLLVDGPHITWGGMFGPRYVCFTNRGPVSFDVVTVGPRDRVDVAWSGGAVRGRLHDAQRVAAGVAGALLDAPDTGY